MAKIQIWMEGYIVTGDHGKAQLLGEFEATDFDDAVRQYNENPEDEEHFLPASKNGLLDSKTMQPLNKWNIWGCVLYDNEEDARRAFG